MPYVTVLRAALVRRRATPERIVDADDRDAVARQLGEELVERAHQRGQLVVAVEMIVFDVGDDRDRRIEQRERTVGLVGFGDEPRRRAVVRVRSEQAVDAAQHQARIDAAADAAPRASSRSSSFCRACRRPRCRGARADSCASISPRCRIGMPARCAATYSGLRRSIAELTTTVCAPVDVAPRRDRS